MTSGVSFIGDGRGVPVPGKPLEVLVDVRPGALGDAGQRHQVEQAAEDLCERPEIGVRSVGR